MKKEEAIDRAVFHAIDYFGTTKEEKIEMVQKHMQVAYSEYEAENKELREALEEVMSWITNWDCPFENDEIWWTETVPKITKALEK